MTQFTYSMKDPLGIHARPAGLLAKLAKSFADTLVTVEKNGVQVKATQTMKLMGLGVKNGDEVTVRAEGANEVEAVAAIEKFFKENL